MAFKEGHSPAGFVDNKSPAMDDQYSFQILTLETLLQFCRDHKGYTTPLEKCLTALQAGDVEGAVTIYRSIPLGGTNGCFDDWFPPALASDSLNPWVVFFALVSLWRHQMEHLTI
jgi:hypothetical protein